MLIVNADDWGRSRAATDRALACYERARISSASAMVFMADSARGAQLAKSAGLAVGLHVNFTEAFTDESCPVEVRQAQHRIRAFLSSNKYAQVLYHPFLRRQFAAVFRAQADEFVRLYEQPPSHMDGHLHMHLCTNMILDEIIPQGVKVRRSFTFLPGQKSILNRAYRAWVDHRLAARHPITDYFFALSMHLPVSRLDHVLALADGHTVELMNHPEVPREYDVLMSEAYAAAISQVKLGNYSSW